MEEELKWSHIRFEMLLPAEDFEPDGYIRTYHGTIVGWSDDDDDAQDPDEEFGTVHVKVIERDRADNDGQSLFEVMDCDSEEMRVMYDNLVDDRTGYWKDKVQGLIDENRSMYPHFMLVELIELKPQYKGRGIGAQVMLRLIQTLGSSCDLVACKPFPTQYVGYKGVQGSETHLAPEEERLRKIAWFKVQAIWERIGFVPVSDSEYYVWPN